MRLHTVTAEDLEFMRDYFPHRDRRVCMIANEQSNLDVPASSPEREDRIFTSGRAAEGVGGTPPLTYQWQVDGRNLPDNDRISGSQSNRVTVSSLQAGDAGAYQLIVANSFGVATSAVARLSVEVQPNSVAASDR